MDLAALAGTLSTVLFASANLPMVMKALRSRDLSSYSRSSLLLGNAGNAVYTIYVVSLPFGPVWVLHGFYLFTMAVMLGMSIAFGRSARKSDRSRSCHRHAHRPVTRRSSRRR